MKLLRNLTSQTHKNPFADSNLEQHLHLLLPDKQFGSWSIDVPKHIFNANRSWYSLVNSSSINLVTSMEELQNKIHPLDRNKVKYALDTHINNVSKLYECEYRILSEPDRYIWVLDRGYATQRDSTGRATEISGITLNIDEEKSTERNDNRKDYVLRTLYSILSAEHASFPEQVQQLLKLGCEYLNMRCGIASYVEGNRYTVLHVYTSSDEYKIQAGDVFDLGITYCKFTLQQRQPVGFAHAAKIEVSKHPSYEALKLEAYLGTPLFLNGKPFGTLNFTSIEPRQEDFTYSEKYFVQLMAEWISNKLQHQFIEKRRLEEHKKLTIHQQHSPLATIEWTSDYRVKHWSKKAASMLGWTEEQVKNKSPADWPVIRVEDRHNLENLEKLLKANQREDYAFECDLMKNDGEPIFTDWIICHTKLDDTGRTLIQTLVLDVTERVQAENNLLISNARYVDLYQNAPDMYFSLDEAGNIMSANNFCHQLLGYEDNELIGKPFWNLIEKDDIRRVRRHIDVASHGDVEEFEMEVRILTKNNESLNTHQRIRIIQPHEGLPRELRILATDITVRSEMQQSQLLHLKKQRDEISREIQHRIKNSLQAVVGLLKVNLDTYPQLREVLTAAISQVDTIAIVNSLMMESGRVNISLSRLIELLINATSNLFGYEIDKKNNLEKEYELCESESIAVSLIISELLINASKYHAVNSLGNDGISVALTKIDKTKVCIQVLNTIAKEINNQESDGSKMGMSLINALTPPHGAVIETKKDENFYEVSLTLDEPILAELQQAHVISNDKFAC